MTAFDPSLTLEEQRQPASWLPATGNQRRPRRQLPYLGIDSLT
jgi:hypothetical protein